MVARIQPARMLFDDAVADRKSKAGSLADRLGGKKRVEDVSQMIRRNSAAIVMPEKLNDVHINRWCGRWSHHEAFGRLNLEERRIDTGPRQNLPDLDDEFRLPELAHADIDDKPQRASRGIG